MYKFVILFNIGLYSTSTRCYIYKWYKSARHFDCYLTIPSVCNCSLYIECMMSLRWVVNEWEFIGIMKLKFKLTFVKGQWVRRQNKALFLLTERPLQGQRELPHSLCDDPLDQYMLTLYPLTSLYSLLINIVHRKTYHISNLSLLISKYPYISEL